MLLLGQYCLFIPQWRLTAVVYGNSPTWVAAFCFSLASHVGLRQLTLHVFSQIKQRGLLLAFLFAEAMCGREVPKQRKSPALGALGVDTFCTHSGGKDISVTWPQFLSVFGKFHSVL